MYPEIHYMTPEDMAKEIATWPAGNPFEMSKKTYDNIYYGEIRCGDQDAIAVCDLWNKVTCEKCIKKRGLNEK